MKQFNWTKIPNNKVISSYWKDVSEVDIQFDPSEVERLFAAKEAPKKGIGFVHLVRLQLRHYLSRVRMFRGHRRGR